MRARAKAPIAIAFAAVGALAGVATAEPAKAPIALAASASASGSASASASAAAPKAALTAEILVLHATNTGGGIDPKVKHLKQLTEPPLSAFNTYKLLSEKRQPAEQGKPSELALPDGRTLRLLYKGPAEPKTDAEKKKPPRHVVTTSISDAKGKDFLPSLEVNANLDEYFFVAGQSYEKGILVLAIKLTK